LLYAQRRVADVKVFELETSNTSHSESQERPDERSGDRRVSTIPANRASIKSDVC